jgi:hypothetical protein
MFNFGHSKTNHTSQGYVNVPFNLPGDICLKSDIPKTLTTTFSHFEQN